MPLLAACDLVKTYRRRLAVDRVSLSLEAGEVVGLLGSNGAGKTTMFRMLSGNLRSDCGRVLLGGVDVTRWSLCRRARDGGLGYLPQEPSVFGRLSVADNLLTVLQALGVGREERRRKCQALLEEFGIQNLHELPARCLSGGQKRRLEFARCLLTSPRLIMLDEPFNGMDPVTIQSVQQIIRNMRSRGISILITDHHVHEALDVSERVYIMHGGRILFHGQPDELSRNVEVRKYYLGEQHEPEPVVRGLERFTAALRRAA